MVSRQLSVLKLHGSAYGLRLGERLKYPLEADARIHALRYIPQDALILVMGFSGSERRIMQMLQVIAKDTSLGTTKPRLIWIQGPGKKSDFFNDLIESSTLGSVEVCTVRHIDTFLQELYFYIANSYQSSAISYSAFPSKPQLQAPSTYSGLIPELIIDAENIKDKKEKYRRPVHLCIVDEDENSSLSSSWATLAGMTFVSPLIDYTIIWIDLENHHTVEGVVAEFFDQIRVIDAKAPSCAITNLNAENSSGENAKTSEAIEKIVKRISEVFQRGRYVLVLDSVEAYARPQMVHHGIPSSYDEKETLQKEFTTRIENLSNFINKLLYLDNIVNKSKFDCPEELYYDSYVVVTIGYPRHRHNNPKETTSDVFEFVCDNLIKPLIKINKEKDYYKHIYVHSPDNKNIYKGLKNLPEFDSLKEHWCKWNKKDNTNSVQRAKDVLLLLDELRSHSEGGEQKIIGDENAINAFICLLSMFRKPCSRPVLRSIIERWGLRSIDKHPLDEETSLRTHRAVNNLLTSISLKDGSKSGVVSQNHEGGVVWLFKEIHETTYDALTEHLHIRAWRDAEKKGANITRTSKVSAIVDGILTITWHISIARTYYADVFLPTHDVRAFYEYLYHRVSATRIITLLIDIVENEKENKAFWKKLQDCCNDIFQNLESNSEINFKDTESDDSLTRYAKFLGVFEPIKWTPSNSLNEASQFLHYLKYLRIHAIETLLMALTRNRLFLRAVATPDTILSWSKQFLYRELEYMWIEIDENSNKYNDLDESDKDVNNITKELRSLFEELEYKALLSKMDYERILKILEEKDKRLLGDEDELKKISQDMSNNLNNTNNMLQLTECYIQRGKDDKKVELLIKLILDYSNTQIEQAENTAMRRKAKKLKRDVLELNCIFQFKKWPFWQVLLEREKSKHRNTATASKTAKGESEQRNTENPLKIAEEESFQYEDMVRETSETNHEDAKYRSSALTFRARALYLQGHFPEAHHFLDLATAGLLPDRLDHQTIISVVHIVRAELLAISAHEHYFSLSKHDQVDKIDSSDRVNDLKSILFPLASSSMKKIERAEQELRRAEALLRSMAHQNIWLIHMEFGWAQIKIERMLFEIEKLFWSWSSLDVSSYLRKSGELEQKIINGMQHLRNVLDAIPYQSSIQPEYSSMIQIERMVYKLWRQYFVIGAYYSSLLSSQYRGTIRFDENTTVSDISKQVIPCLTGFAVAGENAEKYSKRWKLWCTAMRFDIFGSKKNMHTFTFVHVLTKKETNANVSLRSVIIEAMLEECKEIKIDAMWKLRRETRSCESN
ncbi:MAG: hypothetical protein V3U87_14650 [Methylococcaceae bacterium]